MKEAIQHQRNCDLVYRFDTYLFLSETEKYCVTGHTSGWVQYESPKPILLKSYSISSAINLIERTLKSWELLGSNDGINWEILDRQSNQDFFMELNTFEYIVNCKKEYKYFRLNILENNGAGEFQFSKWQLFENISTKIGEINFSKNISMSSVGGKLKLTCDKKVNYSIYNLQGILQANGDLEPGVQYIFSGSEKIYIIKIDNRSVKVIL